MSPETFLAVVKKSGLVDGDRLQRLADEFVAETDPATLRAATDAVLAEWLVRRQVLTRWQAEKLLQGKHKGFFLGKYRLLSLLGRGGMSSVYLAEHRVMKRRCAIKVLPAKRVADTSYLARFHREAQAVAALDDPHIIRAYDVDHHQERDSEIHFLVMEFVDGPSLQELVLQAGPLPFAEAVDYIRQAALGLDHAHAAGLVHRDIKPGNLLVDGNGVVKVLDLGLAKFFDSGEGEHALTIQHDERVLGTADYLSPEQALDSHSVDTRSDIYSLGCTLYFLLTGRPPFHEGTLAQRLLAHQTKSPLPLINDRPDAPADLVQLLEHMMAKQPEARFQTAREVADELSAWLNRHAIPNWRDHAAIHRYHRPEEPLQTHNSAAPRPQPEIDNAASSTRQLDRPLPTSMPVGSNPAVERRTDDKGQAAATPTKGNPTAIPPDGTIRRPSSPATSSESTPSATNRPASPTRGQKPKEATFSGGELNPGLTTADGTGPDNTGPGSHDGQEQSADPAIIPPSETTSRRRRTQPPTEAGVAADLESVELLPSDDADPVILQFPSVDESSPSDVGVGYPSGEGSQSGQRRQSSSDSSGALRRGDSGSRPSRSGVRSTRRPASGVEATPDFQEVLATMAAAEGETTDVAAFASATDIGALSPTVIGKKARPTARPTTARSRPTRVKWWLLAPIIGGVAVGLLIVGWSWTRSATLARVNATRGPLVARQLTVGPGKDFSTITTALNAARERFRPQGDDDLLTILVAPGQYREAIVIDNTAEPRWPKGIVIKGESTNAEAVVIRSPNSEKPALRFEDVPRLQVRDLVVDAAGGPQAVILSGTMAGTTLSHLTIRGFSDSGIMLQGAGGDNDQMSFGDGPLAIDHVTLHGAAQAAAIRFTPAAETDCSYVHVRHCRCLGPLRSGISLRGQLLDGITLRENILSQAQTGVLIEQRGTLRELRVVNNTFHQSDRGIVFEEQPEPASSDLEIRRNVFLGTARAEAVVLRRCDPARFRSFFRSAEGLKGNLSDRVGLPAVSPGEVDLFTLEGQRATGLPVESTDPTSAGFLAPTASSPARAVPGNGPGEPAYLGAVAPAAE